MGLDIKQEHFARGDYKRFSERLRRQLRALERVLTRPDFGEAERSIGAELELAIIDRNGRALAISQQLVKEAGSPLITPEMGAFDIELSTPPVGLAGTPFSGLRETMQTTLRQIRTLAERHGGRIVPISILPTLRREDFGPHAITCQPRYRALARGLSERRKSPFEICIEGEDSLHLFSHDAVAMEAANNAFQVHLSASPAEFADLFNAAMLLSAPVLAAAANSPTFLGRRLWDETRVALFKQAGDDRVPCADADNALPPRVNFGNGWVREGALELFVESVALHPPLLAECLEEEDSLAIAQAGKLPALNELRLHHGTVWSWNRPVYDPGHGGNLRIELRALPSGPSYDDMLANAAFLVGAALGLKERVPALISGLPFALAKQNFFAAAQHGLDARLLWPDPDGGAPRKVRARELLLSLLPSARRGLKDAGVQEEEGLFLDVFEARIHSGQTGAVWQKRKLSRLHAQGYVGHDALTKMLDEYINCFHSQRPVHLWPLDDCEANHV